MDPELRAEAERFAFWTLDRPLVFREIWPQAGAGSWEEELAVLRQAPVEQFAEQLVHGALADRGLARRCPLAEFRRSPDLRERALARVAARHPASLAVLRELIDDPERCRERFAAFLAAYWEACIGPDWPHLAARLQDDIARRGRALSRRGLAGMLTELSPHLSVDPAGGEVVIRPPRGAGSATRSASTCPRTTRSCSCRPTSSGRS